MIVRGARLFDEKNLWTERDVCIDGEFFADDAGGDVLDARGLTALPGLIDLHVHGAAGFEFASSDAGGVEKILRYNAANGITALCPTTLTMPAGELLRACGLLSSASTPDGAAIIGLNVEGPFISPSKLGAQNPAYTRLPDINFFRALTEASRGKIKIVSVAPELDGAMDFIQYASRTTVVAVAHTNADYETASRAFAAGASHVTHLFNAMPPFHHRAPGVVGAAFDSAGATAELICDGAHLHPTVVRAAFAMFGPERIVMVSDGMMATGMPDGRYEIGGLPVSVAGGRATLEDGSLAGSVTNLMDCLRTAVLVMGIPLHDAVRAATANPARVAGVYPARGSISPGKIADMLLVDDELKLHHVILRGRLIT